MAEPRLNAAGHEGLFSSRQTLAFPAPSEMPQPRLRRFPPLLLWADGSNRWTRPVLFVFLARYVGSNGGTAEEF